MRTFLQCSGSKTQVPFNQIMRVIKIISTHSFHEISNRYLKEQLLHAAKSGQEGLLKVHLI